MRNSTKMLGFASVVAVGLLAGPPLYANDSHQPSGSDMGGMMKDGGMTGMMNMMQQMNQMMESCNKMMQGKMDGGGGSGRPNEQWQKNAPAQPEKNG